MTSNPVKMAIEAFKREYFSRRYPTSSHEFHSSHMVFDSGESKVAESWFVLGWQAALRSISEEPPAPVATMSGWMPIAEKPEKRGFYLCWTPYSVCPVTTMLWTGERWEWPCITGDAGELITHWRPLPQPPQSESHTKGEDV